jgi:glutathione peroxidase
MRTPSLLPILSAALLATLAACSSSSPPAGTGAAGVPSGSSGGFTPPPKGSPDDPAPVNPTDDPNAAPCAGKPGELYALSAKPLSADKEIPLCRFTGKVLLVVNVASQCGYTPQYRPLQAIYDKYRAQGFYVMGFPSKSFSQELADDKDVSAFCTNEYKITFPMFSIGNVNEPQEQPVYTWLKAQPGYEADVSWNFEKFLIGRNGKVVKRIATSVEPDAAEVTSAIEAELAKP